MELMMRVRLTIGVSTWTLRVIKAGWMDKRLCGSHVPICNTSPTHHYYICIPPFQCCSSHSLELTPIILAFAPLPLPILSVAFLKLTAPSRPSAPPSGSPKCLRFGHWLTLCTLNIHLFIYLLTYLQSHTVVVPYVRTENKRR